MKFEISSSGSMGGNTAVSWQGFTLPLFNPQWQLAIARSRWIMAVMSCEKSRCLVTGEHGVGIGKQSYMIEEHGDGYTLMGDLKKTFDPQNIFNPGKLVSVN